MVSYLVLLGGQGIATLARLPVSLFTSDLHVGVYADLTNDGC